MKINTVEEHEDGSVTVQLVYTPEEHNMLLEYAFVNLLKDALKEQNARTNQTQE